MSTESVANTVLTRRRRARLQLWLGATVAGSVLAVVSFSGVSRAVDARLAAARREPTLSAVLAPPDERFVNVLLVGSDSRAGADPNDADFGNVGGEADVQGRRSDTLIVVNIDRATDIISLMSIPRDLWVNIGDTENTERINVAYREGASVVVRTINRALGIPIHHYVEIDFQGFKQIVDAVGGVTVCVEYPTRDRNTGLFIRVGCNNLDGVESLAYARSRYFEEKVDGVWRIDGTSDIGRGKRQRLFTALLMQTAVNRTLADPFRAGTVMAAATSALLVDENLDLLDLARMMRPAAGGLLRRYSLDTYGDTVRGNSVLRLADTSAEVLAFYAGVGPAPVPRE
jgi:LCP family protein required for cell wall assembly